MSSTGLLRPGTSIAGYTIEGCLGRGGMATVYRARSRDRDEHVALKLIRPEYGWSSDAQKRFEREARLAAAVSHRNILPVYEAGEHEGWPFIAMRLEPGDLGRLLREERRLAAARVVGLVAQVASALDTAHAHGLVHRDVKPSNVLIGGDEEEERAYVADFGVARAAFSARDLLPGELVGTVGYASPEQIRGEPVDHRTDVYALGCLLYECLTGSTPYARSDSLAILWAHLHDEAPDPAVLVPGLPRGLCEVVRRALAKEPGERFPSAGELAGAARDSVRPRGALPKTAAPERPALPDGIVTLLVAQGMPDAKRSVVDVTCSAEAGIVTDLRDGALLAAFADAEAAIRAAGEITAAPTSVRVGIHTGTPHGTSRGYVGTDVDLAERIAYAAHRSQVVLSASTAAHLEAGRALRPLGSHRLKDFAEPIELYQLGEAAFPPLKTVLTTNLPALASSFLGREEELREADLLLQRTRLLSVTGPGGAGKTRFAIELASRARDRRFYDYENGVFVCLLASLRDPTLVLPTLAQTLSVPEQPPSSVLEALSARLGDQRLLLLLDNIEHLLPAVSELEQLLASCSGLTVLVTSRERLHLEGEVVYELPPLALHESVALFCERAACEPSEPVEELCARLEGLPLAVELAAARMSVVSPEQLLTRLAKRLDLLKSSRDADPRQQTLRATIEWSYDLLAPAAQGLFARLSVFADGCTLEAAEAVCDADLDSLESLLDKSLLHRSGERFWMLETIREYAADLLKGSSEEEELSTRHAEFFAALAERIGPIPRDPASLDEAARDDGNFRVALQRTDASGQIAIFVRLVAALAMYWSERKPYSDARAWLESGFRAPIDDPRLAVRVCRGLGVVAYRQGDHLVARSAFERALECAQSLGDRELECACLNAVGVVATYDDPVAAREHFSACLTLAHEHGYEWEFAGAANNLGDLELSQGRLSEAERWFEESLAVSERLDENPGLAMIAGLNLGLVALRSDRTDEAARRLRESLRAAVDLQQLFAQGECVSHLASVAAHCGDPLRAARLLGMAAGILEGIDGALSPRSHVFVEETRTAVRDSLGEQAFADAFAAGRALERDEAIAYALAESERSGAANDR